MAPRFALAFCLAFAGSRSVRSIRHDQWSHRGAAHAGSKLAATKALAGAIPKEIYAAVPDDLEETLVTALKDNLVQVAGVGLEHIHIFNDEEMAASVCSISESLAEEGVPGAYAAFAALRPGAFKADLWRYMALWYHGGVYLDMNLRLSKPLDDWVNFSEPKLVLVEDRLPGAYWNALMASPPQHPGLKAMIKAVIEHVAAMRYGKNPLNVTGPTALFKALASTPGINASITVDLKMTAPDAFCGGSGAPACHATVMKKQDENDVVAFKEPAAASAVHGEEHYSNLYASHQVFCSESGPLCADLPSCRADAEESDAA